jgi:putative DNA primase/helicase
MFGQAVGRRRLLEFAEAIAAHNRVTDEVLDGTLAPHLIPCGDGVLDPWSGELRPAAPEDYCTLRIAAQWETGGYDPQEYAAAKALVRKFLEDVLPDTVDREGFLRFAGYALTRLDHVQKMAVLVGAGGNGKSKALELVKNTLGAENVSTASLQTFANNPRFGTAGLVGKLANICPDLPTTRLEDTGIVKAITGGDLITAEYKFGRQFSFKPFSTMLFSTNNLPGADDRTEGFYRRLHIIPFTQKFEGASDDKLMSEKLAKPEVVTAFFHLAVDALRRLRADNWEIAQSQTALVELDEYRKNQDSMYAYAQERLEARGNYYVVKDALYRDYVTWCEDSHVKAVGKTTFARRLRSLPGYGTLSECYPKLGVRQIHCWAGIYLKTVGLHPTLDGHPVSGEMPGAPKRAGSLDDLLPNW